MRRDSYSNDELVAIEKFLSDCKQKCEEHKHPQDEWLRNMMKVVFSFLNDMLTVEKEKTEMEYNEWARTR